MRKIDNDGTLLEYSGVSISREASYLFEGDTLAWLLRSRGVDLSRPTRMKGGAVYYIKDWKKDTFLW